MMYAQLKEASVVTLKQKETGNACSQEEAGTLTAQHSFALPTSCRWKFKSTWVLQIKPIFEVCLKE